MSLIDRDELIDNLLQQQKGGTEEIIQALKRQPVIDAIPVNFIRETLEACNDEGYRFYKSGIRFLVRQWRKKEKKETPELW